MHFKVNEAYKLIIENRDEDNGSSESFTATLNKTDSLYMHVDGFIAMLRDLTKELDDHTMTLIQSDASGENTSQPRKHFLHQLNAFTQTSDTLLGYLKSISEEMIVPEIAMKYSNKRKFEKDTRVT